MATKTGYFGIEVRIPPKQFRAIIETFGTMKKAPEKTRRFSKKKLKTLKTNIATRFRTQFPRSYKSTTHNTPVHLRDKIRTSALIMNSRGKNQYSLSMRRISGAMVNPRWLEEGTKPSPDLSSRGVNDKGSLGGVGRPFFRPEFRKWTRDMRKTGMQELFGDLILNRTVTRTKAGLLLDVYKRPKNPGYTPVSRTQKGEFRKGPRGPYKLKK